MTTQSFVTRLFETLLSDEAFFLHPEERANGARHEGHPEGVRFGVCLEGAVASAVIAASPRDALGSNSLARRPWKCQTP